MATDCGVWFYPGGYELMTAVLFLVGKSDLLWFVPDLVSWTLLVVSTYGLLCLLGVNRNAAALVVGTIVLSPVVRSQLTKGNNDLLVAALAVGAVAALGRRVDKGSRQARAAGLVCLGAMVGTKYAAFPLMLILVPFVVFQRRQSARPFGRLEVLAVVVAGILLVSFPLRNILVTGNPVFPVGVWGLFPWGDTSHVSPGVPAISPEQLTATSLAHQPPVIWRIFLKQVWHWAAFLPVLAVMALVLRLFKKWSWSLGRVDGLALTTALLSFAAFVTQPLVVGNHPGSIHQIASGTSLRFGLVWIILLAVWLFAKIRIAFPCRPPRCFSSRRW